MSEDTQPLVSVVMPTYNEPPHIVRAAIWSILHQTYRNWELFIIDDSTNGQTRQAIDETAVGDRRIKVIRQEKKIGFVPALNLGIELSNGLYIARMDGDDVSLPDRLTRQVTYLTSHPDVDILGGAMNIMDESGTTSAVRTYPGKGVKFNVFTAFRNPLAHPTVMFRSRIKADGHRYDTRFPKAEDLEFWLRLRNLGYRLDNMAVPLLNYRVIDAMVSKRDREQFRWNFKARHKNFSVRHILYDTLSCGVSACYCILPSQVIAYMYARENKLRE